MTPAPSAQDLEIALQELLRKNRFPPEGHLRVFGVVAESSPAYLLTLSPEAAAVLMEVLAPILADRKLPSPTEWVLFQSEAVAILAAV
jgi:hypothetical protein